MSKSTLPLTILIEKLSSLPGIGYKSASRLAYHILTLEDNEIEDLTTAIVNAHKKIKGCSVCGNYTQDDLCDICSDKKRQVNTICVVEDAKDISAFERSREYIGTYHILGGLISPMDGIGPDKLNLKSLLSRVSTGEISEVIMATNPTVEGEATAMYISKLIKPFDVLVTRIAYGLPVGADLEYTDEVTLSKALQNRSEL